MEKKLNEYGIQKKIFFKGMIGEIINIHNLIFFFNLKTIPKCPHIYSEFDKTIFTKILIWHKRLKIVRRTPFQYDISEVSSFEETSSLFLNNLF